MRYLTILILIFTLGFGFNTVGYAKNTKKNVKGKVVKKIKKVNINTATVKQLSKLQGIGAEKARAIIKYRQKHGRFKRLKDLMNVKGIGPKLFEKIKPFIKLR